jgi:hypothetical protein
VSGMEAQKSPPAHPAGRPGPTGVVLETSSQSLRKPVYPQSGPCGERLGAG